MVSLEKNMYFVPNRIQVRGKEMYVSFNIGPIPSDMNIVQMVMQVPLPYHVDSLPILVQEVAGGWDEGLLLGGYTPPLSVTISNTFCPPGQEELQVNLAAYEYRWRFDSLNNHGIHIRMLDIGPQLFSETTPPYLIVTTD